MKSIMICIGLLLETSLTSFAQQDSIYFSTTDSNFALVTATPRDSIFPIQTFGRKAFRAGKIILLGEVATMAFFYMMPESFSNWNKNFYQNPTYHWKRAFTMPPKWDDDPVFVNYVQHPLAGAIYYNGMRSQGASKLKSFLFACAESTFFEYFIESVAERPSTQDLIVTPLAGSIIGEVENKLTIKMKRNGFTFIEKVLVFFINPMYVLFNGYKDSSKAALHY